MQLKSVHPMKLVPTSLVLEEDPDWCPLERLGQLCARHPDLPTLDPGEFMYMAKVVTVEGTEIHLYKHIFSRRYVNLDHTGNAWWYVPDDDPPPEPRWGGWYTLVPDVCAAVEVLDLREFGPDGPWGMRQFAAGGPSSTQDEGTRGSHMRMDDI